MTRVLIWIAEATWRPCVAELRGVLPPDAELTLVHVGDPASQAVAAGARAGLLGRRPPRRAPPLSAVSEAEARALLEAAADALARPAALRSLRGRAEEQLVAASAAADLLVLARDGGAAGGPKSLSPRARFVTDHARCAVLLLPGGHALPPPPPPPGHRPPLPSDAR